VDVTYLVAPLIAWVTAGSMKLAISILRSGRMDWAQVGLGGLPSIHTAVVSATAILIGLREGVATPLFALALTLAMIVIFDALHLRREVGAHAAALNDLLKGDTKRPRLREHVGHQRVEVVGGLLVGLASALVVHAVCE
jgi:acid phosphatase family membrane protein YuiD